MAATSGINRSYSRASAARLRQKLRNVELLGHGLGLFLAVQAVLLLVRFAITGLGWAPASTWGIGIVSATSEVVGPFYHLFGAHPLTDLGAAVCLGTAAQLLRMLLVRKPLPRLSLPTAWGSSLPAALN